MAIELDSNYALAYYGKGLALFELGLHIEAIKDFDKAIELQPKDAKSYAGKGKSLYRLQQYEAALGVYEKALELDGCNQRAFMGVWTSFNAIGNKLCQLKKYDEAIVAYKKALQLETNSPRIYYDMGNTYYESKQYMEASEAYEKCILIYGSFEVLYVNKIKDLFNAGIKSLGQLKHLNEIQQNEAIQYPAIETDKFDEINGEEIIDENMLMPDGYQKGEVIAYAKYTGWDFDNPEEYYFYKHFVMEHVD
jgi:tetratricopeptide (TPR) repeat protein